MTPDSDDNLLAMVRQRIDKGRRLPEATYRLQFHAGFTFRDACCFPFRPLTTCTLPSPSSAISERIGTRFNYSIWRNANHHRSRSVGEAGTNADFVSTR